LMGFGRKCPNLFSPTGVTSDGPDDGPASITEGQTVAALALRTKTAMNLRK
jgi:hypothetical protein